MMRCESCQRIDFSASPLLEEKPRNTSRLDGRAEEFRPTDKTDQYFAQALHPNVASLKAATTRGCHLCIQALDALERIGLVSDSDQSHHDGPIEARWYPHAAKKSKRAVVWEIYVVARTGMRDIKGTFQLVEFADGEEVPGNLGLDSTMSLWSLSAAKAQDLPPTTRCDVNFAFARLWLRRCLSSHLLCTVATPPDPPLPTNVLDVTAFDDLSRIRLVNGSERRGKYITLSHVWGKLQIITTEMETLPLRQDHIQLDELSQTFRDAVELARQLSIKYLWIDSLCIIQDSAEDWTSEAAKMNQYYSNSLINICAVSSSDGSSGIFWKRDPRILSPFPMEVRFPGTAQSAGEENERTITGFFRPLLAIDDSDETDGYMTDRPPLWQRAWVLQERMLPTRLLMFSNRQMSWLCRCEEASEMLPEGRPRLKEPSEEKKKLQEAILGIMGKPTLPLAPLSSASPTTSSTCSGPHGLEMEKLYNAWYDLVAVYTKCGLTIPGDIFPAIAGLASRLGSALDDDYVAGLWKRDLHRGLLWSAVSSTKKLQSLRDNRAPSWSWASLPATCAFMVRGIILNDIDTSPWEIIEAQAVTGGHDRYGEVKSAYLFVKGLLKKANPVSEEAPDRDERLEGVTDDKFKHSQSLFDLEARAGLGHYFSDNEDLESLTEVWCTPVISAKSYSSKDEKQRDWHGLAMVPVSAELGDADGKRIEKCFKRVGGFTVRRSDFFKGCKKTEFFIV